MQNSSHNAGLKTAILKTAILKTAIGSRRLHRARRGIALATTLTFMLFVMTIGLAFVSLSSTSSQLGYLGWQKTQANELAEAGVYAMYAQIANSLSGSSPSLNSASIPATTLSSTFGSSSAADGTYSAYLVSHVASTVGAQTVTTFVVEGDGIAPNGRTQSQARATFTETTGSKAGNYGLQDAAITSAGNVLFQGGATTSDTSGSSGADAFANGTITVQNSSTYTVDGTASAYVSSPSLNATDAKNVTPLTTKMSFPSPAAIASQQSAWLADAQESTPTYPGGHSFAGNETFGTSGTITAPEYVSGDLTVQGGATLTLQPDPAAAAPSVLYVHGKITVSGGSALINNGVLIVSDGTITVSGGSNAPYVASDMTNSGLISFSTDSSKAINLSGGSTAENIGVLYAFNGGITLSGGSKLTGSATTASSSATVTLSGGGTHLYYSSGMNSSFGGSNPTYTASTLGHWVRPL